MPAAHQTHHLSRIAVVSRSVAVAFGLAACGASGGTGPVLPPAMTALIDGVAWESFNGASARRFPGDSINITGAGTGGITLGIGVPAPGPGTYSVGPATRVGVVLLTAVHTWQAGEHLGSGSVTFTTLTATRATGTFQFSLEPFTTGAVGVRSVTQGRFDLAF